jgi:hydroxymethylpyrimidine pyrophosphatase-like HAD family hydrolase
MISNKSLIIAIDFDGTIVEDNYPKIGKPMVFAFETIKKLEDDGHRLILWTYRSGRKLKEAVDFCKENGVEFYAVNESYDGEVMDNNISRKINADIFVDDRNIGGFIGWGEVYHKITNIPLPTPTQIKKKKGFLSIFK